MSENKEAELRELIVTLARAMEPAGRVLADIGQSRSQYADEAWAAFSHIVNALNLVRTTIERDMSGPLQ